MQTRRDFVKGCSMACAVVAGGGITSLFSNCSSLPIVKTVVENKTIVLDTAALQENLHHVIRSKQLDYDLLLSRLNDGSYRCIYMQCTHQDYAVRFTGSQFVCNQHGSTFDLEGNVKRDPATDPLRKIPVTLENDKVVIHLNI